MVCIFWGKYHYARPRAKKEDLLQPLCGAYVSDEDKPRLSPLEYCPTENVCQTCHAVASRAWASL